MLQKEPDIEVVGESPSAVAALKAVEACSPDVAVLDVRLADGNGIAVCEEIRLRHPEVACLIFTSFTDDQALVDSSEAGAAAYVLKQVRGNDLVDAIRRVSDGALLLDAATVRMAHARLRESGQGLVESLTEQERRIFELVGEGMSNREIAAEMYLAEKTVKNYVSSLLAKLGMSRRTEAAAFAARLDEREQERNRT